MRCKVEQYTGLTIGVVNKGRHGTLKYFSILMKIIIEHRLCIVVPDKHKINIIN